MLFRKSFQTQINGANRVFTATIDKLKNIQADINARTKKSSKTNKR